MSGQETFDDGDIALAFEPHENPVPDQERERRLEDPGFGRVFTDHMAVIDYNEANGWHGGRITARKPFAMDPASPVLHYARKSSRERLLVYLRIPSVPGKPGDFYKA